jgi:uncharacterized protein (DUF1501 family)
MPNLYRLYRAGEASIVHAVATPYRERSHFDGQDVLESGLATPGTADTGWLNRALVTIEPGGRIADERNTGGDKAFAVGPIAPLVVRGPAPVLSWTPPRLEPTTDDTLMRLLELYRHTDVSMARALEERIGLAAIARAGGIDAMPKNAQPAGAAQVRAYFAESAGSAAKFIARPDGPRVGALAFNGLGHPRQRGRSERPPRGLAGSARRGHRGGQKRHGSGLARHRHCRGDGIRAHGPY